MSILIDRLTFTRAQLVNSFKQMTPLNLKRTRILFVSLCVFIFTGNALLLVFLSSTKLESVAFSSYTIGVIFLVFLFAVGYLVQFFLVLVYLIIDFILDLWTSHSLFDLSVHISVSFAKTQKKEKLYQDDNFELADRDCAHYWVFLFDCIIRYFEDSKLCPFMDCHSLSHKTVGILGNCTNSL